MKKRSSARIATLGFPQLSHPTLHGEAAVRAMIDHLNFQLDFILPARPDLILFPEACDRFSTHTIPERLAYYRERGDRIRDMLSSVAAANRCHIAYSAARQAPDGTWRNTTELIGRDGTTMAEYHKNHCVVTEISDGGIRCGEAPVVCETDFGRVGFVICFDLNFQELREKYRMLRPDLILFSSMYHGGLMQNFWAYDLNAYFAASVCGMEAGIVNPVGCDVARSSNYSPYLATDINLDFEVAHLDFNWTKLQAARKKYGREIEIFDGGKTGVVMLSSNHPERTALDVCREFEIELWRDYYQRSLAARANHTAKDAP
ncbi:MAG: carbon-nitrogen hydrolase family protein [Victivallaceae bacterium]|nr:carbon-nitrogen hydrolase family protein [Victivallaceae bacterium]